VTKGSEIYYNQGSDNGDTWSSSDSQVSDGDSSYPYPDDKFPRIAVSGATVHITWQKETRGDYDRTFTLIDDEDVTHGNSFAIGTANTYHVSYYRKLSNSANAFHKDPDGRDSLYGSAVGSWLGSSSYCQKDEDCHYTSIDLDMLDLGHVAFYDGDDGDLDLYYTYEYWEDPWTKRWLGNPVKVDGSNNNEDMGQYLSMALEFDQGDFSKVYYHISYFNAYPSGQNDEELMYATGIGSTLPPLTVEVVDKGSDGQDGAGKFTSIALDTENRPHISYYDADNGNLKYAKWTGTTSTTCEDNWDCDPVDTGVDVGQYTSIAIDSKGKTHISYYDVDSGDLKYAKWTGTTSITCEDNWDCESVDSSTDDVGKFSSLVLDVDDQPHISYYDDTNDDLKFAFKDSSGWHTFDAIDSEGDVGSWSSMSLGLIPYYRLPDGCPQITYVDATNSYLKHVAMCSAKAKSDIMHDQNKEAGESGKWGTDQAEVPWAGLSERVVANGPDIAVWGNDIHMPYHIEWQEDPATGILERGAMGYINHLDTLTEKGDLPDPPDTLMGASAVRAIYDGGSLPVEQIYIIGGVISETGPDFSDKVWRYDPTSDTYVDHCDLPRDIAYTSAVYEPTNGVIYVFGGLDENEEARDEIIKVHPTTLDDCTDEPVQALETERYGTSAVYLDTWDTILVFGGVDTQATPDYLNEILVWQPGLGDAVKILGFDLPQEMAFTSAVTYGSGIAQAAFVFGGQESSSSYLDEIVKVHRPGGSWASGNLVSAFLPTERSGTSATFDGTYGYVFGGKDDSGRFKDILRFNPRESVEGAVVKLCYQLPAGLQYTAAAYAEDTLKGIYVFGGGTPDPADYVVKYRASYDSSP
jgi:hypothetical protein